MTFKISDPDRVRVKKKFSGPPLFMKETKRKNKTNSTPKVLRKFDILYIFRKF